MKEKRYIIYAIIIALTYCIDYDAIYNLSINVPLTFYLGLSLLIPFFLVFKKLFSLVEYKNNKYEKIISIIFSIFALIGSAYKNSGTIFAIISLKMLPFSFLRGYGYYLYFSLIINVIKLFVDKIKTVKLKDNFFIRAFKKNPFKVSFLTIIVAFSFYYICFYPCTMDTDPALQLLEFLNYKSDEVIYIASVNRYLKLSNLFPIGHTFLLGGIFTLGRNIINDNFGLFLYALLQGLFMAYTFAKTISFLKKRNVKDIYLLIILGIYAVCPSFAFYALCLDKDVCYSLLIIHLVMELFDYVKDKKMPIKRIIRWFFIMLLICLFRNNGIYLLLLSSLFIIFVNRKEALKVAILFITLSGVFFSYQEILLPHLGVESTTVIEGMSMFFQGTGRYAQKYDKEITTYEKEIINGVISYKAAKNDYDPEIADNIKKTYNHDVTNKQILDYLNLWFKMGLRHPGVYIDSLLNNVYGYFDPYYATWYLYNMDYPLYIFGIMNVNYHPNNLNLGRNILRIYSGAFAFLPGIRILVSIGCSTLILIAYTIYFKLKEKKELIVPIIPLLATVLMCILSPMNGYFRYAAPFVFCIPLIIGVWIKEK